MMVQSKEPGKLKYYGRIFDLVNDDCGLIDLTFF